jgi:hypothetical protein
VEQDSGAERVDGDRRAVRDDEAALVLRIPRRGVTARQRWFDELDHAIAVDAYETAVELAAQGWTNEAGEDALVGYAVWLLVRIHDAVTFGWEWRRLELDDEDVA